MGRIVVSSGLVLGFLALAGAAAAQITLRGSQTATSLPAASSAATGPVRGSTPAVPPHNPDAEPKVMAGMLHAQNEARARLGLPALTWSGDLSAKAEAAANAAGGLCTQSAALKAGRTGNTSIFWSAPLRRLGGAGSAQDISPSYLVSEWSAGRTDYDLAATTCRRSGTCDQYARMVAPAAKAVGCSKTVCESGAQVWACQYGTQQTPKPDPSLRRRTGD
jgi:hypothetical protein